MIFGGAQIAKLVVQLVSTAMLGRLLFPSDFGLLAMVAPIIGFVQLLGNLGFAQAIVQKQSLRHEDVSALFWINLAISLALVLAGVAAAPFSALLYREPRILPLMIAIALIIPIGALGSIHGAILARQMRFGVSIRNDLISTFLGVIATIAFAAAGCSYWSLMLGQAISALLSSILAWISVKWRPLRPAFRGEVWEDIKFGANLTGANIATFVTSSGDNIIIGALNGNIALGIYDRSYKLVAQPITQMLGPISGISLPLLSRLLSDPSTYRATYLNFLRIIMLLNLPVMLVCIANAKGVVTLLLGPNWLAAAPAFSWISVGGLLSGFYTSLFWLFISQAKTAAMRHYMWIAAVFNLGSFAVGATWGVVGVAACAALVFIFVTVPLVAYGATRTGPISILDILRCCAPYAIMTLIVGGALGVLSCAWRYGDVTKMICSVVLCLPFPALFLLLPEERRMSKFAFDKIRARFGEI